MWWLLLAVGAGALLYFTKGKTNEFNEAVAFLGAILVFIFIGKFLINTSVKGFLGNNIFIIILLAIPILMYLIIYYMLSKSTQNESTPWDGTTVSNWFKQQDQIKKWILLSFVFGALIIIIVWRY